jgi:uncharacterized protein YbjQ (UPF0145 family)
MPNEEVQARTPYNIAPPRYSVSHSMVTTGFDIPGWRIRSNLGVVRGIIVRSRNVLVNIGAAFQTIVGGNITAWTKLCEETRAEAFEIMIRHATELGANAIIGARYDTTELGSGVTEVLAYGTAVIIEPLDGGDFYR